MAYTGTVHSKNIIKPMPAVETAKETVKEVAKEGTSPVLSKKDAQFRELSLNGPMWKVILRVGLPLALFQSLQQIFSILDTMMASHISAESVSAVAYMGQLITMLSAVGSGLAVGAGIQISRAYGMGDYRMVRRRISSLYTMSLTAGLGILVLVLPFSVQFLRLSGMPEELIAIGSRYFAVQLFVTVVTFLNEVYISVERARGNTRRILLLNLLVITVKLTVTAVSVYILHGGLVMIAVASLLAQLVLLVFAVNGSVGRKKDKVFGFSRDSVTMEKQVCAPMVTQSIPVMLEKALFAYGKTVVNAMSVMYGPLMVGALGISNNLGGVATQPQSGFKDGASAVISQNFGAGRYKRVLSAFYTVFVIDVLIGVVFSGVELLCLNQLAGVFAEGNVAFRDMIAHVYVYEAIGCVFLGMHAAVLALLYGLGKTKLTLVINFARVFIFRIPVLWYLQNYTNAGESSVGIMMMVSNVGSSIFAVVVAIFVIRAFRKKYMVQ